MSNWIIADNTQSEKVHELSETLNIPLVIGRILLNRGIRNMEEARRFFKPDWKDLHDPFLMKDMDRAVDRIIRAFKQKERILIYGDYDVDGITSVSLLYLFLKKNSGEVSFYIPDRLREGYGLSTSGVTQAAKEGASLLITVDCGITGIEEVRIARQLGLDVIISDHHEQGNIDRIDRWKASNFEQSKSGR